MTPKGASSNLASHPSKIYADVAQLAAQLICNQRVVGSSPTFSSDTKKKGQVIVMLRLRLRLSNLQLNSNICSRGGMADAAGLNPVA